MTTASMRRDSVVRTRLWVALIAVLAILMSPLWATSPAAAADGYVGVVQDGGSDWPDKHLAVMTTGEYYADSLEAPFDSDDRDHGTPFHVSGLPDGLTFELAGRVLTLTGTPTSADPLNLTISWYGTEGAESVLVFTDGVIESGKAASTTTLQVNEVLPHSALALGATVTGDGESGTPTGVVEFWAGGASIATATVNAEGIASASASLLRADAGSVTITAKYLGDENHAPSDSAPATVRAYIPSAQGVVLQNDVAVSGAVVELLSATTVIDTDTTGSDGTFTLSPGTISSATDADKLYLVRVVYPDSTALYYNAAAANVVDIDDASEVGPLTWKTTLQVKREVAPVWTDITLATPRQGSTYSDFVVASSPTVITYSVTAGSLPAGLSLIGATGEIEGTPSCEECAYDFTVTADNDYGSATQRFTGTVLPAGIAPTWSDNELPNLQVSVGVNDQVVATGDATIVYAISTGALPAGLTLSTATGVVTGTPTIAGPYEFEISASNEFGSVVASFIGTVAAAPEIDLTLNFDAGTALSDASSVISAGGLKVGSTYTLTMHSTPVVLYTGIIGPTGGFTWTVALPADTRVGAHRLVLSGIAPDGSTMTAQAWFTLLANGTIGAISYTGPLSLAATGADVLPAAAAGFVLLTVGAILTVAGARRRRLA